MLSKDFKEFIELLNLGQVEYLVDIPEIRERITKKS